MQPIIPAHATQVRRHRRALSAEARAALRDYASARSPWAVPFTWMQVAGHEIVMIDCAASLEEESDALQNGIASCEPECRAGQVAMASIRRHGERVASVGFARDAHGEWGVVDVVGRGNRNVPHLAPVAAGVLARLNEGVV